MSKSMDHTLAQTCPQCDNHCPVDALQCGRGRKYFGVADDIHEHHHGYKDHDGATVESIRGARFHDTHKSRNDLAGKLEHCGRLLSHSLGKRRGQGRILHILYQRGEMSQQELQELLGIQAGSMSEIAAKLEDKGLIVRVRSQEDRRKVSLSITEEGRALASQGGEEHILQRRAELFSALTPEEQHSLESLLDKLSNDWSKRLEHRSRSEKHSLEEE